MNSSSRNNRNNRRRLKRKDPMTQRVVQLLTSIDAKQTQQERGLPPRVPDVFPLQLKRNKIYTVSKTVSYALVVGSTAADVLLAYGFSLASSQDAASYAAIFDSWRIAQVTIRFMPGPITAGGSALTSVLDYDDLVTVPLANLYEYDNVMITQPGQIHIRTLNPRCQTAVFVGATPNPAMAPQKQWVDMSTTNVPYCSVKIALPQVAAAGQNYSVTADIVFQFRNTR
jgi:hypothetical protein